MFKKKGKKQEDPNVLGNNEEFDKEEVPKKKFNIQLSEEDKDVYEINDDDEEDEEEEEEKVEKVEKNDKATKEKDEETNKIEKETTNKSNEIKEVENDDKVLTIKENEEEENMGSISKKEREIPYNSVCHYIYRKGSYISLNDIDTHPFEKIKISKNKFTNFFKFGNKSSNVAIRKKYLAFFDENYLYFMKDIPVDAKDKSIRRIGNKFNLLKTFNAFLNQNDEKTEWIIKLEFMTEQIGKHLTKEMIFNNNDADKFYQTLSFYFQKLNLKMTETQKENEN